MDRPHWGHPFRRGYYVEQDTTEHVLACESRIVLCPMGARLERPEFGWPWPMFQQMPIDLGPLEQALRRSEPRGDANARRVYDANFGSGSETIEIDVEVKDG